jgi:hypothetical protein
MGKEIFLMFVCGIFSFLIGYKKGHKDGKRSLKKIKENKNDNL